MKKKIIVLGSLGMAGHVIFEHLNNLHEYEIIAVARQPGNQVNKIIDVSDFNELEIFLTTEKPDYVINCIGVLVSKSNSDSSTAILMNSYLPNFLSELGKNTGYKLIHISTDCVFSGRAGSYAENAYRDGDDNYARSKILGEIINKRDLTIRTSIIGPELKNEGTGLFDWFLKQTGTISGYSEVYWSGVTTLELAKAIEEFINQDIIGLYHLCPSNKISKMDLLLLIKKTWSKDIEITSNSEKKFDKSLVCTRTDFSYHLPDYEKMLLELKDWINSCHNSYNNYYPLYSEEQK